MLDSLKNHISVGICKIFSKQKDESLKSMRYRDLIRHNPFWRNFVLIGEPPKLLLEYFPQFCGCCGDALRGTRWAHHHPTSNVISNQVIIISLIHMYSV